MPVICYVHPGGSILRIEVNAGANVMRTVIENEVWGIEAICGGSLNCATCHVYVESEHSGIFVDPGPEELEMLDAVAATGRSNSRLSYQLFMPDGLDVLTIYVPDRQI